MTHSQDSVRTQVGLGKILYVMFVVGSCDIISNIHRGKLSSKVRVKHHHRAQLRLATNTDRVRILVLEGRSEKSH